MRGSNSSTTQFELLRMDEDETINEFYSKLLTLSKECFALGKEISDYKLVKKILRPLPKRFGIKVTAKDSKGCITF